MYQSTWKMKNLLQYIYINMDISQLSKDYDQDVLPKFYE